MSESIIARKVIYLHLKLSSCINIYLQRTSIGANIHEAVSGNSTTDFIYKLGIALKDAKETNYWLGLLKDSNYTSKETFDTLYSECNEIIKILSSIILTTKQKYLATKESNS
ncbi:MAG: four helix bundle protein [Chitinophagaceae bacterium]